MASCRFEKCFLTGFHHDDDPSRFYDEGGRGTVTRINGNDHMKNIDFQFCRATGYGLLDDPRRIVTKVRQLAQLRV